MLRPSLKTLLAWVSATAVVLVVLAIITIGLVDKLVIAESAADDRHRAFLLAAAAMSRSLAESGGHLDVQVIEKTADEILQLRPGLRRLSFFDMTEQAGRLIWSSDPSQTPQVLPASELTDLRAGRSPSYFDESTTDHAWMITAPVTIDGRTIGALRGRFSVAKFDRIAEQERDRARVIAVAMVGLTCLAFLVLIQRQVHRPIHRLLDAMGRAEAGDLTSRSTPIGPTDLQEVSRQFNRMLDRVHGTIQEKEVLLGEIRNFNATLTARVDEAKRTIEHTHAMLVDARVQAERNEKLAALGELSAVIAHELGNPLNAISGHLQLAEKLLEPVRLRRHLAIIKSETDRMVRTIQTLLDSTKIHGQTHPLDLNAIIREVLVLIGPTAEGQQVRVKTDFLSSLPPVLGDPRTLHGMVFNLVTNALQAMQSGGELELLTTDVLSSPIHGLIVLQGSPRLVDGGVRLIVRDTGIGIAPDALARIFEPFYTTRHQTGGTGLGLTICQRTITLHSGRLAVQSRPGHGTQFTIDLPTHTCPDLQGGRRGYR